MCQNLLVSTRVPSSIRQLLISGRDMTNFEGELLKRLQNDLRREAPCILSALLQRFFPPGTIHPDTLDQICEQSTRECITLVFQLLARDGNVTPHQPYADSPLNRPCNDRVPLNSYRIVRPWLATAPPPSEFYSHTVQPGQTMTSSGDAYHGQLAGNVEQNSWHHDIGLPGSATTDYCQTPFPEQPNGGIGRDQLEPDLGPMDSESVPLDFDWLCDFVDQNTSSWESTDLVHRTSPDSVSSPDSDFL